MMFYFVRFDSPPSIINGVITYSTAQQAAIQWFPIFATINSGLISNSLSIEEPKDFWALFQDPCFLCECTCDTEDITQYDYFFFLKRPKLLTCTKYDQYLDLVIDLNIRLEFKR